MNTRWLPLVFVTTIVIGFRVLGSAFAETLPNFQPLPVLFFCGFLFAPGWRGFAWPAAIYFLTYPVPALLEGRLDWLSPAAAAVSLLSFGLMFSLGHALRPQRIHAMLGGAIAAALLFHLLTNGCAWLASPLYPKSPLGLWQSLWLGPAGSPIPSWAFLKNLLAANVLFTAILIIARLPTAMQSPATPGLTPAR